MRWSENDRLFKQMLREGRRWEEHVKKRIERWGHPVHLPELSVRASIEEATEYLNQIDLTIYGRVFEVKSRKLRFTSPDDFPYDDIMVDTVRGYMGKDPGPAAYICVSQETGRMICLDCSTFPEWKQVSTRDRVRNIEDSFYEAPRSLWRDERALRRMLGRLASARS